jgi:hypothetical protein
MDGVVLVLNQNYEPLNVCNLPRAFRLLFGEKAEVIEYDHQMIRTPRTEFRAPRSSACSTSVQRPRPVRTAWKALTARGVRPATRPRDRGREPDRARNGLAFMTTFYDRDPSIIDTCIDLTAPTDEAVAAHVGRTLVHRACKHPCNHGRASVREKRTPSTRGAVCG